VSFLASIVDPEIAIAAARESIDKLKERQEQSNGGDRNGKLSDTQEESYIKQSPTATEEAGAIAFGSIAARSQVLTNNVERQTYSTFMQLMAQQQAKIELKLRKFSEMERAFEGQRRELDCEREQVFLDRLAMHRKVRQAEALLQKAVRNSEEQGGSIKDVTALLTDVRKILSEDTRLATESTTVTANVDESDDVRPISMDIPQTYKFWSA
jgi:SWI/SNF complex subunit SWI3